MRFYAILVGIAILVTLVIALPATLLTEGSHGVSPQVANVQLIANLTDPSVSRDSCVSMRLGDRVLWTCRDTEVFNPTTGKSELPLITNSAGWTTFDAAGKPLVSRHRNIIGAGSNGSNPIVLMAGGNPTSLPPFLPVPSNRCPDNGICNDGTRWPVWPSSPPLVTTATKNNNGTIIAYMWVPKAHQHNLTPLITNPATMLYRITFEPSDEADNHGNALPTVDLVTESFWPEDNVGFGTYGGLIQNGTAYLYGRTTTSPAGTALARVPVTGIEDVSQYRYYVSGQWTKTMPNINNSAAVIPNAGTGSQGGFYYSAFFDSILWIGQGAIAGAADFHVTTSPSPEGPWIEPYQFYVGSNGNGKLLGSYSCVPNPALLTAESQDGIYLTWTQAFNPSTYGAYVTPLVYVTWK